MTLKYKLVTIRKQRKCYSCLRTYHPGNVLYYWVGLTEGDFGTAYCCPTCHEIMKLDSENEFPEGYVTEMLNKNETPEQLLARLTRVCV